MAAAAATRMNLNRLLLLTCIALAPGAHAQDLRSCRALQDAAARLGCYDKLPLPAQAAEPPARAVAATPPVAVAALPVTVPTPAPSSLEASFGLQGPARVEAAVISSSVAGRFDGWGPKSRIRLANGQVWEVTDGSRASVWMLDPQVVVRRAALGSFLLEVEGLKMTARVQRVE
jgi:hypothetical protein